MLEFQRGFYYVKNTQTNKIESNILTKSEAKKRIRVLEVDDIFNKMIAENGTLGIPKITPF
jgi:hypothetical protein